MGTYKITYFAPYNRANFTCEASSMADGQAKRDAHHAATGWCVANREIKTEKYK